MQEKNDEIKINEYKENLELFDMPKDILSASLKELYKDDKSRLPIFKYFKEFMSHYADEENQKVYI